MRDRPLNELFERFRARGDTAALAEVFDRTAPALFKVARHLLGKSADAEDAVQSTFLAVIEGAARFDASRPLEPWLFGILVKQAALARRVSRRPGPSGSIPGAERRDSGVEVGPDDAAAAREAADAIESALRELPPVYREVLAPRFAQEARAVDVARLVGRTPSVVRAQIHRGLALLKRLLPAGLAPAFAFLAPSRRALAAVRARVIEHAATSAGVPVASASAAVGGIVIVKKLALVAVAVLVALGATLFVLDGVDRAPDVRAPAVADAPPPIDGAPALPSTPPADVARVEAAPAPTRVEPAAGAAPKSFVAALCGITGRVLTADGAPLADAAVELIELRLDRLFGDREAPFSKAESAPTLVAGTGRTDAHGRFVLQGARAHGLHGLCVDPGGPRAQLRIVDLQLSSGAVTDLGDVVLAPTVAWCGKVVDADGAPVADARVRAVPVPLPLNAIGAEQYRRDSSIIDLAHDPHQVIALPAWLDGWIARLPIATASTGADGRFEIIGVPQGTVVTVVDAARFVSAATNPEPSGRGARHDVGTIELSRGRAVDGRVVDSKGRGVAAAEVIVGAVPALGRMAFARPAGTTDADGRFHCDRLPDDGALVAAARHAGAASFSVGAATEDESNLVVTMPPESWHRFVLKDASGAPVDDVRFRGWATVQHDPFLTTWTATTDLAPSVHREAPGVYRLAPLPVEGCVVLVKSESHGVVSRTVEPGADGGTTEIAFAAPRRLKVRVVAADGATPIEWADVAAYTEAENIVPLVRARTGADGVADLGAFENAPDVVLRTEHPGFAPNATSLAPDVAEVTVALDSGGSIEGRVTEGDDVPQTRKSILLYREGDGTAAETLEPLITTTDARGDFAFTKLVDGAYRWQIFERFLDGNPFELVVQLDRLRKIDQGEVHVDAGKVARLDIRLPGRGPAGSAIVRGSVRLDGAPVERCTVGINGADRFRPARTDASGRFEVGELAAGRTNVWLMFETNSEQGAMIEQVSSSSFTLGDGEVKTLDFDLRSTPLRVHVVGPDRKPVSAAEVLARGDSAATLGLSRSTTTDADGDATLVLLKPGSYRVEVRQPAVGRAATTIDVSPGGRLSPIEITLDAGAPLAGRFTMDGVQLRRDDSFFLDLVETEGRAEESLELAPEVRTFEIHGLPAGHYRAVLRQADEVSDPIEVVLPAQGDRNVTLAFRPRTS